MRNFSAAAAVVGPAHGMVQPQVSAGGRAIDLVAALDKSLGLNRLNEYSESQTPVVVDEPNIVTIPTACVIVSGDTSAEIKKAAKFLRSKYGMKEQEEGVTGTLLLRAPSDGIVGIQEAFAAAQGSAAATGGASIQPNFFRARTHRMLVVPPAVLGALAAGGGPPLPWNLQNVGAVGVAGADVGAVDAWKITKGKASIRVAVLDEGVDTVHPDLKQAVALEKDFIGTQKHARPQGNDAHGTACAGIIVGRSDHTPGLAPNVKLVAARIARSNPAFPDQWLFDDFKTQDAIDWCWKTAKADVLSNSWGGGLPSDAIRLAFARAKSKGRGGKGCVVVIAAGNSQSQIPFPADLPDMLVVGAHNEWGVRKTKTSQDGEFWWGSNFGPTLSLMAPGVHIRTTDISGAAGYDPTDYTPGFNGTSSAAPHVAAAAALVLSLKPTLTEKQVRDVLIANCTPMTGTPAQVGKGRLNAAAALAALAVAGNRPKSAKKAPKKSPRKKSVKSASKKSAKKDKP